MLGEFAVRHGIKNYNHMDFYCWPIFELENGFDEIIDQVWHSVANYRNELSFEDFAKSYNYDYIKQMYEAVIPKELRHALGEYYTPDWLAEETLNQAVLFYDSNKSVRLIDPTCGSGTFLFKAIGKKRSKGENLQEILDTVCGIDINPLAVLTAKTNYLLAVIDMLQPRQELSGIWSPYSAGREAGSLRAWEKNFRKLKLYALAQITIQWRVSIGVEKKTV